MKILDNVISATWGAEDRQKNAEYYVGGIHIFSVKGISLAAKIVEEYLIPIAYTQEEIENNQNFPFSILIVSVKHMIIFRKY